MILNRVVPAGGIINDILQGNAVEVVVYRLVESLPHGQGDTLGGARTLVYGVLEAAHGAEAALGDAEYLADGVLVRVLRQRVSPLIAAVGAEQIRFVQQRNDLL